ncbi:hypothetical protein GEMRC1_002579 [Eukaryota sp. GEM-RC1]
MPSEIEVKLSLTETGFQRMISLAGPPVRTLRQTNHYFIIKFSSGHQRLRLRLEEDNSTSSLSGFLTIKQNGKLKKGVSQTDEFEIPIDSSCIDHFISHPNDLLSDSFVQEITKCRPSDEVSYLGSLLNIRYVLRVLHFPYSIEMDETHFPLSVSYSLECEASIEEINEVKSFLENFLTKNDISFGYEKIGKMKRFLKEINAGR